MNRLASSNQLSSPASQARKLLDAIAPTSATIDLDFLTRNSLLLAYLSGTAQDQIPVAWQHRRAARIGRNLQLQQETLRLIAKLHAAGIENLLLKGLGFAHQYYGGLSNREFSDIDLLVKKESVPGVIEIAKTLGYQYTQVFSGIAASCENFTQHACCLKHSSSDIEIDIHWRLAQKQFAFPDYPKELWQRCQILELETERISVPAPIDSLLTIAVGGVKEAWSRGSVLLDFARCYPVVSEESFTEEVARLHTQGLERLLTTPLAFLSPILLLPPNDLRSKTHSVESSSESQSLMLLQSLATKPCTERTILTTNLAFRSTFSAKLRYVLGRVFIPHQEDWHSLPKWLLPCIVVTKPLKTIRLGLRSYLLRSSKE